MKTQFTALLLPFFVYTFIALGQKDASFSQNLLTLGFENTLAGEEGESPVGSQNIQFAEGISGQSLFLGQGAYVDYNAAENLNALQGTISFWIRPAWDVETETSIILEYGGCGGILIFRNFNSLRSIFNRFACAGNPELDVNPGLAYWSPDRWYHVAVTWGEGVIMVYINGEVAGSRTYDFDWEDIPNPAFRIGQAGEQAPNFFLDEFRIADRPKSQDEMEEEYLALFSYDSFYFQQKRITRSGDVFVPLDTLVLLETHWSNIYVKALVGEDVVDIPTGAITWQIGDTSIADFVAVNGEWKLRGKRAGRTTVGATLDDQTNSFTIEVEPPVLPVHYEVVDPYLKAVSDCAVRDIPVVIIRYLNTQDGETLDISNGGDIHYPMPLNELRDRINTFDRRVKFMLTEGSRYRGYKDSTALPYLGYQVVDVINVYEPLPSGQPTGNETNAYFPDYYQVIDRFDGAHYVNDLGVKEFWIWGPHDEAIVPVESNMSSPTTGDISNSFRFENDLPVYEHTYVLYNYNYGRTQAEAVHNHGHQLESILGYVNLLQDDNLSLFWGKFVGSREDPDLDCSNPAYGCSDTNPFRKGRAGWTHMPPNTTQDYDYLNSHVFPSDIEDWRPDESGDKKMVSRSTWANLEYHWPDDDTHSIPQRDESQWYIYWMQNMPGYGNVIPYGHQFMTNWWAFTADWDASIASELGLYRSEPSAGPPRIEVSLVRGESCAGEMDGMAEVNISGAPPEEFTYTWDNGETTSIAQALAPGKHQVSVTNQRGCATVREIDMPPAPPGAQVDISVVADVSCNGEQDGALQLVITSGTQPFFVTWDTGDTTQLIAALGAGTYQVSVVDGNGCTEMRLLTLEEPEAITTNIRVVPDTNSMGVGQATFTVRGGTSPYLIALNDSLPVLEGSIDSLLEGAYQLHISDANNCRSVVPFEVGGVVVTGVQSLPLAQKWRVYPNPFNQVLHVEAFWGERIASTWQMVNSTGQVLWEKNFSRANFVKEDISFGASVPPGVYLLSLTIKNQTFVKKVVKN